MEMAFILRENEMIEDLRFKSATTVTNFQPKTRKWFKGCAKIIFNYGTKQLAKVEQDRNAV